MFRICLPILLVATVINMQAQSISNSVIGSTGGTLTKSNNGFTINYMVGETMIETYTSAGVGVNKNTLTQGFLQPENTILTGSALKKNVQTVNLDAYFEDGTGKLVFVTNTNSTKGHLILERQNNQTGQFESLEFRDINKREKDLPLFIFRDVLPQGGDNFYRVKQVTEEYGEISTPVRKLNFREPGTIAVFPNPASDELHVDLSMYQGKNVDLYIFNEVGQLMIQKEVEKISKDPINIDLTKLVDGNYQIHIAVEGKRSMSRKFIVSE
jgi:Secretion system C-terminal sorting domain